MTAKEEALELVTSFSFLSYDKNKERPIKGKGNPSILLKTAAKQCALIAVNKIIEIIESDESAIIVQLQYWKEVKTEIEKL
jgi:hypothetical protein